MIFFFFFFFKYCSREKNSLKTLISWEEVLGRGAASQGMAMLAQHLVVGPCVPGRKRASGVLSSKPFRSLDWRPK